MAQLLELAQVPVRDQILPWCSCPTQLPPPLLKGSLIHCLYQSESHK